MAGWRRGSGVGGLKWPRPVARGKWDRAWWGEDKGWQRATLPPEGSTIAAKELNGRVRYGNGCFFLAMITSQNSSGPRRDKSRIWQSQNGYVTYGVVNRRT